MPLFLRTHSHDDEHEMQASGLLGAVEKKSIDMHLVYPLRDAGSVLLTFLSQWVSIRLTFNGNDRLSWSLGKFNVENRIPAFPQRKQQDGLI
jgi:hypothetical protein